MRAFGIAAGIQFVQYVVLTINFRAIADGRYAEAGASAVVAALLMAVIVKRVVQDDNWHTVAGMMVGGGLADMTGIWLTRHWS